MRLIDTNTWKLVEINEHASDIEYGILSHTWEDEEVTHEAFKDKLSRERLKGWQKLSSFLALCNELKLQYAWVDTCCIDKSSSAELSEAINSMWRYYERAFICCVYLCDYRSTQDAEEQSNVMADETIGKSPYLCGFTASKWFTRGWTLQELLAPKNFLYFFDKDWQHFGSREYLWSSIHAATGIDFIEDLKSVCIAKRMSWASNRKTTKPEDTAYCLLGLFNVNMPLLYGEGAEKAFYRLQLEIIRQSDDDSIFAWFRDGLKSGLLARSPADFAHAHNVRVVHRFAQLSRKPYSMTNQGLDITLQCFDYSPSRSYTSEILNKADSFTYLCVPLNCTRASQYREQKTSQASINGNTNLTRLAIYLAPVFSEGNQHKACRMGPIDEVLSLNQYERELEFLVKQEDAELWYLCHGLRTNEPKTKSDLVKNIDVSGRIWEACQKNYGTWEGNLAAQMSHYAFERPPWLNFMSEEEALLREFRYFGHHGSNLKKLYGTVLSGTKGDYVVDTESGWGFFSERSIPSTYYRDSASTGSGVS